MRALRIRLPCSISALFSLQEKRSDYTVETANIGQPPANSSLKLQSLNRRFFLVLDQHDRHYLRGGKEQDLILASVFNPPKRGDERHNLNDSLGSAY
ncbi:ectoine synthase [Pseudomonas sp. rhizo66]|uniref:ectoine synthase n=1 Tax=Pseudomonas sp. rhizo66 TaxID=3059674 RepID=UPI003FA748E7